jgi:hypothetical protein
VKYLSEYVAIANQSSIVLGSNPEDLRLFVSIGSLISTWAHHSDIQQRLKVIRLELAHSKR